MDVETQSYPQCTEAMAADLDRMSTRLANRNGPKTMPTQQTPQHTPWRYERSINGGIVTHALLSGSEDMPCVHVSKQTVMRELRSRVKRNARTPEQLRNAIAARWPKRKASGQVRNGKSAKKS